MCGKSHPKISQGEGFYTSFTSQEKQPKMTYVHVQVTKASSGCRNYDSCSLGAKEEVGWQYGNTKSAEGGGQRGWWSTKLLIQETVSVGFL